MIYRTLGQTGWQVSEVVYGTSDAGPLDGDLMNQLVEHRWDRQTTEWSQ